MSARWLALVLAAVHLGACQTYAPTGVGEVSPGQTVRLRLTPAAEARLPSTVVPDGARFVEGEVVEREGGEVTLAVVTTARQRGFFSEELHERVRVDLSEAVEVERRELDRPRTYVLLAAAGIVVTTAVIQVFTGKTGGNTIPGPGPGPSAARIHLLRLGLW